MLVTTQNIDNIYVYMHTQSSNWQSSIIITLPPISVLKIVAVTNLSTNKYKLLWRFKNFSHTITSIEF